MRAGSSRLAFKAGSPLAKLETPISQPIFIQKPELDVMRHAIRDLDGEDDSFQLRYRVMEVMAASPVCSLTWWPPTEDMLAIVERPFRATLKEQPPEGRVVNDKEASQDISKVDDAWSKPGMKALTIDLASALYQELVRHQKEQTTKFDVMITKREEQRKINEENDRVRQEAAEHARRERHAKLEEEQQIALRLSGKAGRAKLTQIRAARAALEKEEAASSESKDAWSERSAVSLCEKAWPGGTLTRVKLDTAFQDLPDRPSEPQLRYFFEKRRRYCDGQDNLATEGFVKLVRDLGHLQADLSSEKMAALQQIFKKMDTRRRGEISLADILVQIETQEAHLLMPVVDALLKTSDTNRNGLLDIHEFPSFHMGWSELHRIFEVYDDCRLEENWAKREYLEGQLTFAEVELLSSIFLGIKSKSVHGRHVALYDPVVSSLDLTTPDPTMEEIDAALGHAKAEAFDLSEFMEVHRKLRWFRCNPGHVSMHRQVNISLGVHNTDSATKDQRSPTRNIRHPQSIQQTPSRMPSVFGAKERTRSVESRTSPNFSENAEHLERLKEEEAASQEQREEMNRLAMFLKRKEMHAKASTVIMEALLKNPAGINNPLGAQNKTYTQSSFSIKAIPVTESRSDRDMHELVKFFRVSPDFRDMQHHTLMELTRCCTAVFLRSNSTICDLKDWGKGYWIILVGVANVYMTFAGGKKIKVSELRPGQSFGELFLLFGEFLPRRFQVVASTDGVLAAFVDKDDYFAIGLDDFHRSTTWESLSKKHSLLRDLQSLNHLDPIDKFHMCYQLREQTVLARSELYSATTDYVDAPKSDQLLRDATALLAQPGKYLMIVQSGTCDVWGAAPEEGQVEEPTSYERDLSQHARFQMTPVQRRLRRVSNLAAGAIFGSFATGPTVCKITASETSSVMLYTMRPEEALNRLRREGVQKIFQQRESREKFIESTGLIATSSQKRVNSFVKGERDLKQLGTMLSMSMEQNIPASAGDWLAASMESSNLSSDELATSSGVRNVASQYSAGNLSMKIPRAVESAGGMKPSRCRIQNQFEHITRDFDVVSVMGKLKAPMSQDRSGISIRGAPPKVPQFSKEPGWLDCLAHKVAVAVRDPLNTRQTEGQQKIIEAFHVYESWQNMGRSVDLHRYLDLMKASHLVGSPSDPRDNLLTSITMDDAVEVFKQVSNARLPTASLLKGGRKTHAPQFILTRFTFSQCMNLIAMRLRIPMPDVHNFPIRDSAFVPVSNKATRVSLSGSEQNLDSVVATKLRNSLRTAHQEQRDISRSGRPGSSAYMDSIDRRPATSCGFVRATGNRENTSDGLGRNLTRSERPHSSVIKINPTRPGSACLVNMLVSSSRLPDAPSGKAARPNSPTEDDDQKQDRSAVSTRDSPTAKPSVIDRIYGVPGITGVMAHIDLQREKRTRSVKRSLKRLRLPVGLYVSGDNPAQKSQTYQMLQHQLYGEEPAQGQLHWISPSVVDHQLHTPPPIALHQHLHSTPVFLTSLSSTAMAASQINNVEEGHLAQDISISSGRTLTSSQEARRALSTAGERERGSASPQIRTNSGESSKVTWGED